MQRCNLILAMQGKSSDFARLNAQETITIIIVTIIIIVIIIIISSLSSPFSLYHLFNQVLQFIGREDVNQYVVISYTMLVSEKAELEIEVVLMISNTSVHIKGVLLIAE